MNEENAIGSSAALNATDLAYERTVLAHERTLMAWIRTATSLISFGFTIYKLLTEASKANPQESFFTPRLVGMSMILIGLLGLTLAQIQHFYAMKKLKQYYPKTRPSLSSILTVVIVAFGIALFFGALFRQ